MPSLNRLPPYIIAAAVLFMITFYHVFNVRKKNSDLERDVKVFKEALTVSKEKNKVLVKDALEKIDKKDARINQLEQENLSKHTKLGETQTKLAKIKSNLEFKKEEIRKLHQLGADHQGEISTLTKSVSKSKQVLTKLSAKADHLMSDHKKLKKENAELRQENEKLQNDIKQHQSDRQALDEQLNALKKEKEILSIKVDDLTKKNEIIQESIKQKIKESYAARRVINQRQHVKGTEDKQPKLKASQDSTHTPNKSGHTVSEAPNNLLKNSHQDQVLKVITDSSDKNQNNRSKTVVDNIDNNQNGVLKGTIGNVDNSVTRNVSRIMVNNSEYTRNNVSRIMVNNSERWEKRDMISDSSVAKNRTTTKDNFVDGQESLNNVTTSEHEILAFGETTKKTPDSLNVNTTKSEILAINPPGFQPEIITPEKAGENLDQGKDEDENFDNGNMDKHSLSENNDENFESKMENGNLDRQRLTQNENENFESKTENGNTNRESLTERKDKENFHQMRTGSDVLPVFPKIEDETINKQRMQSPRVYGNHLQDDFKHNPVSVDETNT